MSEWAYEPAMVGDLVDRLRGKYPCGPRLPGGEPEFGYRQFPAGMLPPIHAEAAAEIERLRAANDDLFAACEEANDLARDLYRNLRMGLHPGYADDVEPIALLLQAAVDKATTEESKP